MTQVSLWLTKYATFQGAEELAKRVAAIPGTSKVQVFQSGEVGRYRKRLYAEAEDEVAARAVVKAVVTFNREVRKLAKLRRALSWALTYDQPIHLQEVLHNFHTR